MKQIYIIVLSLFTQMATAQVCSFTQEEVFEEGFINPPPYEPNLSPDGGINEDACINRPYEFKFVIYVPEELQLEFIDTPIPIDSVTVEADAVRGLPDGLVALTNNNGLFIPGQADCLVIQGTPTSSNSTGDYELKIDLTVHLTAFGAQNFTLPDPDVTGDGTYTLSLKEEGGCMVSSISEVSPSLKSSFSIRTNPASTDLVLDISAKRYMNARMEVVNLFGQSMYSNTTFIGEGHNQISIDVRPFPQGVFFIKYQDEHSEYTRKFNVIKP